MDLDLVDAEADGSLGYDFPPDLLDALRGALHEDHGAASDEEVGTALASVLDSMSPAESFNFAGALSQIGSSASRLLSDPTVRALTQSVLPLAAGSLGTAIGGPLGSALGAQLGSAVANALPARPAQHPAAAPNPPNAATSLTAPNPPAAAAGSTAAAQGLILSQHPQMLQSLLSAALGERGRQVIGGVPVPQMLALLSQVMGQAAADADELMYLDSTADEDAVGRLEYPERSLYTCLLDVDNLELADELDVWTDS